MILPSLSALSKEELAGKRVLVRVDLDLPVKDGKLLDAFRIKKALPTIEFLRQQQAKVVLIGHTGRDPEATLAQISDALQDLLPHRFVHETVGESVRVASCELAEGAVLMLENLRSQAGEKANDPDFAAELAHYADLYVNESFATSHRAHASIVGLPKVLPAYAGFQLEKEVEALGQALSPESPSLFILGGAKFDTKLPVLRATIEHYDQVAIGGALANDFIKAQGHEVGDSLVSDDTMGIDDLVHNEKLIIPTDAVVERADGTRALKKVSEIEVGDKILDIGPDSTRALADSIKQACFVLWNGPLGYYEGGYAAATEAISELIAAHDNVSIIGGGDTIAAIAAEGLIDSFTHLSTGGGAMLEFLADKGELPGIQALLENTEQ